MCAPHRGCRLASSYGDSSKVKHRFLQMWNIPAERPAVLPDSTKTEVAMTQHLHDWAARDPLACIEGLHALDLMIHDAYALAVAVARANDIKWDAIAQALGVSTPTAHRRYAALVEAIEVPDRPNPA